MQIVTECEKTIMYKVTWRDVYGEIKTDYIVMNDTKTGYTAEEGKRAAEEIIKTTNEGDLANIIETVKVKHNNIYVAVV